MLPCCRNKLGRLPTYRLWKLLGSRTAEGPCAEVLTPPSDEAMRYDLEFLKEAGFNMLRKHIKVEPARYYYWTDRLGLLVWQHDVPGHSDLLFGAVRER